MPKRTKVNEQGEPQFSFKIEEEPEISEKELKKAQKQREKEEKARQKLLKEKMIKDAVMKALKDPDSKTYDQFCKYITRKVRSAIKAGEDLKDIDPVIVEAISDQ